MGVPIHYLSLQSFCDRKFSHVRETALRLHSSFDFGALLFRYEVLIMTAIPTNIYWMLSFSYTEEKVCSGFSWRPQLGMEVGNE